jgi:tRNA pseudouridine38-40 synthase
LTPAALKVRWVVPVADEFNPRYDATARRYMYLFYESAQPSPLLEPFAVRASPLDDELMHRSAQALLGEQDFTSFRASGCQAQSPFRCIHRIGVHRAQSLVCLDVTANAFLLHMVRNIAGALLHVGRGGGDRDWLAGILEHRERSAAPATAQPQGLYLVSVSYPGQTFPPSPPPGLLRALGGLDRF